MFAEWLVVISAIPGALDFYLGTIASSVLKVVRETFYNVIVLLVFIGATKILTTLVHFYRYSLIIDFYCDTFPLSTTIVTAGF